MMEAPAARIMRGGEPPLRIINAQAALVRRGGELPLPITDVRRISERRATPLDTCPGDDLA